ncbi:uncharacterized mitochondrial protein AtMg00810-like [Capsicum annuum]|uniref:uncharacterized mitochondrial protein AtMg00810-like n=1 Tax=Capsicum annuum TaxID=4072 RepID=UPI001FB158EE|nr:uncharacterized mitochondrial protein AtMg00810-like [Capsicum annuum]
MKDLGELKFFLGIEFARSSKGIVMSQIKYALELIAKMGLGGAKPAGTPLESNLKLTSTDFDNLIASDKHNDTGRELEDTGQYQRLIGRILYLTRTRIDIAYAVQVLSQFIHKPKQSHMDAALRVVRYIKEAPEVYCNIDWGGCLQTRRSVNGYLVMYGGALISWKSKKQATVARSSAEAEFRSMASAVAEITWLKGLFQELGVTLNLPIHLFWDSKQPIPSFMNVLNI